MKLEECMSTLVCVLECTGGKWEVQDELLPTDSWSLHQWPYKLDKTHLGTCKCLKDRMSMACNQDT